METGGRRNACKGSVTVFLSLLLLMVMTLILGLLESARVQTARVQCIAGLDLGLFSLFGEYDRDLLEEYDLFFLDGGEGKISCEYLNSRLKKYIMEGTGEEKAGNYTGIHVDQVQSSALFLAADQEGAPFRYQAVLTAKEQLLSKLAEGVLAQEGESYLEEGESLLGEAEDVSADIENLREKAKEAAIRNAQEAAKSDPGGAVREPDLTSMEFENPIDTLKKYMEMGVLCLAGDAGSLSGMAIDEESLMSRRKRAVGFGELSPEIPGSAMEGFLFDEYILDRLSCFTEGSHAEGTLSYQCEYVLSGKGEDRENLESVLEQILLVRFGLNFTYLLSSSQRQSEAETLAAAVCGILAIPGLTELIKTAILLLWAYEESLTDVHALCQGGKVPLVKTDDTFHCTIQQLFSFEPGDARTNANGLDYADYLRILLASCSLEERTLRCMDMVEHVIRISKKRPEFCLDNGIFAMRVKSTFALSALFLPSVWTGGEYETEETFWYMEP